MNIYKIDWNKYSTTEYPYALYVKQQGWFKGWEHITSFKTKEEAKEHHKTLIGLPIYL